MKPYNETILIVEDDKKIQNFITFALTNQGFSCLNANTIKSALNFIATQSIDVILLDLGLPDGDGIDLLKQIREFSDIPVIIVSARDQDKEKATALDLGADDYLTKPFSTTELNARIRVALRHMYKLGGHKTTQVYQVGELQLDCVKRLVYLEGEELHLTPMEYSLLGLFFKNIGKVLTTTFIIQEIWGVNYGTDTQALRTLMASLRRKIEKSPAKPRYILTEIGVGYRMMDE